jgi:hypothetical protein
MYYAALLVFVALVVFFITPSIKKEAPPPTPAALEHILREVKYMLGMPKTGNNSGGTRNTDKDKKASNSSSNLE